MSDITRLMATGGMAFMLWAEPKNILKHPKIAGTGLAACGMAMIMYGLSEWKRGNTNTALKYMGLAMASLAFSAGCWWISNHNEVAPAKTYRM